MTTPPPLLEKIIEFDKLHAWRDGLTSQGRILVVTNGCFDIIHAGHVTYLHAARRLGDCLLVGLNSDSSVRALKGPGRPLNPEQDRALVLAALADVDAVCVFSEVDALSLINAVRPDVYVKGGDYTIETINQRERRLVEALGGRVEVIAGLPGRSTSTILDKLLEPGSLV